MVLQSAIWTSWERHRRSRSMARELGIPLLEFINNQPRLVRHPIAMIRTIYSWSTIRPNVIFAQSPSLILALMAVTWGRIFGVTIVIDAHNAGIYPFEGRIRFVNFLARWIVSKADITIVTNEVLAKQVSRWGGRPAVIPDPLPVLDTKTSGQKNHVVENPVFFYICTWADDEPFMAVLEAARLISTDIKILVSGCYQGKLPKDFLLPPNIVLTGFLSGQAFDEQLVSSFAVIDLTYRESCLVCGAYEAIAAGTPLILSETDCLKTFFYKGAIFTKNDSKSIAEAIAIAIENNENLLAEIVEIREILIRTWREKKDNLLTVLDSVSH